MVLDSETLGNKKFYVFEFIVKKKGHFFRNPKEGDPFALLGWLYYFIPNPTGNQYFISAMYMEAMPKDWYMKGYKPKYLDCFKEALKSMNVKE